jgi:hypothetical protein
VTRGAIFLFGVFVCAAGTASADERSLAVVTAFHEACLAEPPFFPRIDAKAAAAHLRVATETGTPRQPEGWFNHLKSWIVHLPSGNHELSATEARGPAGEVMACAITAPDPQGEAVKQDLMQVLGLGPAEREMISPDGQRRSSGWYLNIHAEKMILLLIDGSPANGPGIYINVTHRLAAGS